MLVHMQAEGRGGGIAVILYEVELPYRCCSFGLNLGPDVAPLPLCFYRRGPGGQHMAEHGSLLLWK